MATYDLFECCKQLPQQQQQQQHKENVHPQQERRQSNEAASKRQAIYGVLFGKRALAPSDGNKTQANMKEATGLAKELTAATDSEDDDESIAPIRCRQLPATGEDGA